MNAKRTLALLLLTAIFCLTISACCFDPYRRHRSRRDDGGRHGRRDFSSLQVVTAPPVS